MRSTPPASSPLLDNFPESTWHYTQLALTGFYTSAAANTHHSTLTSFDTRPEFTRRWPHQAFARAQLPASARLEANISTVRHQLIERLTLHVVVALHDR